MRPLGLGAGDPNLHIENGALGLAYELPEGPAAARIWPGPEGAAAELWGPGAEALAAALPALLGHLDENPPLPPLPGALAPRLGLQLAPFGGLRMCRAPALWPSFLRVVLGQLVTFVEARRSWAGLLRAHGRPAPGPLGLLLPPTPEQLAHLPTAHLVALGVPDRMARTLRSGAQQVRRIERARTADPDQAAALLQSLPGVGPWTAQVLLRDAIGDADAVPTGDYHLPNTVAWALAGEPRADDARMLSLLEPLRPARGRFLRRLEAAGVHAPRYGPRSAPRVLDPDRD